MIFDVRLVAIANVSSLVTVEADSEADARIVALRCAEDGGATWRYDGLTDDRIEVGE